MCAMEESCVVLASASFIVAHAPALEVNEHFSILSFSMNQNVRFRILNLLSTTVEKSPVKDLVLIFKLVLSGT